MNDLDGFFISSGNQPFDHVTFSGTTYAKDTECSGYIGFIFGYQSTKRYYLAIWRHKYLNMDGNGGTKGVQLRVRFSCMFYLCLFFYTFEL